MSETVRVVVAEGTPSRKGFLRFVLEGEGYEVVGEAANPAELARSVSVHEPDVVVMDDGIGAISVGMVHDLAPLSKVVLVWPSAVMPIGGDARVEPANVLRELGLAVEGLTGVVCATSLAGGLAGARDAATLREVLARGEAAQLHRPGEHEPDGPEAPAGEDHDAATAPIAAAAAVAAAAVATAVPDAAATALNRRLGTIALSGAAAAGALVLALALGGSRVPVDTISGAAAEPSSPGIGQPSISPVAPPDGDGGGGAPGGRQGGGGTHSRGGTEPLCNYYVETCLPPAGLTGTGGLSIGDIYGTVDASGAASPKTKRDVGRAARSDRHDGGSRHGKDRGRQERKAQRPHMYLPRKGEAA